MSESAVARSKVSHDKPALNQLIRQTLQALLLKATPLTRLFRRQPVLQNSVCFPRQYEKPTMRKVTVEQAKLLALGLFAPEVAFSRQNRGMPQEKLNLLKLAAV